MNPQEPFRGIFPVLQTPLDADGALDEASLAREVDFCVRAGAHGVVFPVLGSEYQYLTRDERCRLVEVVVGAAARRITVVAGVAATNREEAVEHARHAADASADAVIALPPETRTDKPRDEFRAYYEGIAEASRLPVFIQHSHATMDVGLISELLASVENIRYVKEEMHPSAHNIGALVQSVGAACSGVFGGAHNRWMLSELRRGAVGFMPAVEAVDVHVRIWNAYMSGDEAEARRLFNSLLPLLNLVLILGLPVCKEVLVRRGVISSAGMRMPGSIPLDEEDHRELDAILADVSPLFTV
ncbi:dihydrodipicolinate synthase family protein [Candidatus Poribacteria bacterium]|nr:dihydrodipicolinate synthase family protein [Candidatus Poribacteria bacterium]